MASVVERFGAYIDAHAASDPERCRALLVTAFRAYRLALRYAPHKGLPRSRQDLSITVNKAVVNMLGHPDRAVLTSIFMPCELLWAMDLEPMCAEMYSAFVNGAKAEHGFVAAAEEAGVAETFCSYHKVLMGGAYAGILPAPAMVANASLVCDANNLTFRALAEHFGVPQYFVDVPSFQGDEAVAYVADELRELTAMLQDVTGRRLDEARLRQAMENTRATMECMRAAIPLKRTHSLPGDVTSELYELYATHIGLGAEPSLRYARMLLEDLKHAPAAHGLRILWVHVAPHWQRPVCDAFNFNDRAQVVVCDMSYEGLVEINPERPYESMAGRLVNSAWNGPGQRRIDRALELAQELEVDGVVCFCHWGCKQIMGLSTPLKHAMESAGYPTLVLDGDGCDRANASDGQTATRLGAFLEMLEGRRG